MALIETTTAAIGRVQIARYAGAVGDFNPIHVDEEFAKASGMPSVIAHGPLTAALIIDTLVAQVGAEALESADVRFRTPVFPGDTLMVTPTEGGAEVVKADGTVAATLTLKMRDI
ncbi:MaoC family dehydratase N-terminal domain-containing protein (plasmid) [Rhodococcus pseudokoreensis]|uniref:MaoC family dehydratase N-terminal domain-containing protein n=1 Tax=Rhodococcus pseudokoreensis TaxID=2811421 RepID=A0A974ZRB5_9NOCA|nr:MaoC/PaaZ C-terminal domain-containing protein [Rhodococcus pseudokoreensis]QSE87429.1 MaoC family dehydratase N-terminal domain-containing protein [Rhodococcus pseudokoreensis]